ncbi:hypothetical protein QUF88_01290 [Bacillus sp. DX1.1]|uniref:hypothetical protein n=1 Tax=unclassified Bacillus (in: firmicutes) TaxID=185979 RepID=UPI00257035BD|nr:MULTISPECIES: hypothetical protein [unclassified Bacillus (in: firmicutes)]MDM5152563.1 hypothetical protein [Bacillus sp. DX1.1]MDM5152565.1 hypothetical protein [Bacillus sp. DX1.1]MDM5152630.1 hypothetical protein [Bacillus sp. DX1.1]WJE79701.1 hypothetical protein QRE67_14230 [Bacillus sp. DX3.1]WJE79702.1 hypothetical protein QRE67_14240 [Bacillus sp. DX3.1]
MYPLGSKERPIIVKVSSKARAEKVAAICEAYNFYYIVGLEFNEDVTDLKKQSKIAQGQQIFMRVVHVTVGRGTSFVV